MNRLCFLVISSMVCGSSFGSSTLVSISELLIDPHRYDKQEVLTFGVISLEFEGFQIVRGNDALWLELFSEPPYTQDSVDADWARIEGWRSQFEGKCVILRGTLEKSQDGRAGHFGLWPAEIDNVTDIRLPDDRSLCD